MRQERENAELVDRLRASRFKDLAAQRHRIDHFDRPKVEGLVGDLDPVGAGPVEMAAFADRGFEVIDIDRVGGRNVVHEVGPCATAAQRKRASEGPIAATSANR